MIDPTEGQIIWDGVDVTAAKGADLRHIRRQIGMVFQQFNLVKRSSVITNVLSGRLGYVSTLPSLVGIWSNVEKQRAIQALETVGISDKRVNLRMLYLVVNSSESELRVQLCKNQSYCWQMNQCRLESRTRNSFLHILKWLIRSWDNSNLQPSLFGFVHDRLPRNRP